MWEEGQGGAPPNLSKHGSFAQSVASFFNTGNGAAPSHRIIELEGDSFGDTGQVAWYTKLAAAAALHLPASAAQGSCRTLSNGRAGSGPSHIEVSGAYF